MKFKNIYNKVIYVNGKKREIDEIFKANKKSHEIINLRREKYIEEVE